MQIGTEASVALQCVFDIQTNCEFEQTGRNTRGGNYTYFKLEDLLGPAGPILAKHQCVILFSTDDSDVKGGFEKVQGAKDVTPKDKLVTFAFTNVTARIQSIANVHDYVETKSFGYKVDQSADKALGAYTIGARYACMAMFKVQGDIDPDADAHDVRGNDIMSNLLAPQPQAQAANTKSLEELLGV